MDETALRVLSGDFLDSRLPPIIIITLRRVCKRLCRPLRQYLTDFLRYKHVRVASMYISELAPNDVGRPKEAAILRQVILVGRVHVHL